MRGVPGLALCDRAVPALDLEPDPDGRGEGFAADVTARGGNRAAVEEP